MSEYVDEPVVAVRSGSAKASKGRKQKTRSGRTAKNKKPSMPEVRTAGAKSGGRALDPEKTASMPKQQIVVGKDGVPRCWWAYTSGLQLRDHDEQWGRPCHDSDELFARLCLECMQAGLSWSAILKKQAHMRQVFHRFQPSAVATMEAEIPMLLQDPGIIRNRRKVEAIISNAKLVVALEEGGTTFADYLWAMVGGKPVVNRPVSAAQVPVYNARAELMSKTLKKAGFKFVGPTIMYAFMQSTGMINDHIAGCFRAMENPER